MGPVQDALKHSRRLLTHGPGVARCPNKLGMCKLTPSKWLNSQMQIPWLAYPPDRLANRERSTDSQPVPSESVLPIRSRSDGYSEARVLVNLGSCDRDHKACFFFFFSTIGLTSSSCKTPSWLKPS